MSESVQHLRLFEWSDLDALVALIAACESEESDGSVPTAEDLRHQFEMPGLEATRYIHVLPGRQDGLAAAVIALPLPAQERDVVNVQVMVRPDLRDDVCEGDLLRFAEARAFEDAAPRNRPYALQSSVRAHRERRVRTLEEAGYRPVRYFLQLARDLSRPMENAPVPPGVLVRPIAREQDVSKIYTAVHESFQDHWNPMNFTEEQMAHWIASPDFRPEMVLLALAEDGDVAGVCINSLRDDYNRQHGTREGYVNTLGVRRPWRGRGLGRALLMHSLRLLKEAGMDTAVLDVDMQNPTGATQLYSSVGFEERKRSMVFEKSVER